jgi:translation initiation factor IF-3
MDYGKWRYQQQKKEDKSRASSRAGRLKQINVDTVRIGDHDLEIKMNRARDFLKEGNKVQFTLRFKGREMAHLDLGRALFNKVKQELFLVSKVERDAKMEGKRMTLVLQPDHKDPTKLKPADATKQASAARAGSGLNIPSRPPVGGPVGAAVRPVTGPALVGRPAPVAGPAVAARPIPAPAAPVAAPRPVPARVTT